MAGERSLGSLVYWMRIKNDELKRKAGESGKAIQDMSKQFDENKRTVKSWSTQVKGSLQQVSDFAKRNKEAIQAVAIGGGAALAALTLEIRKATKENVEFTNALIGLRSIAEGTGQDLDKTTQAAEDLAADGLMSVADAATGLKNLLLAGFGLDESVVLMERFKDSAAFGRQGALSFGEAIRSATEGVKNGNSILVDNAGVTKNLSVMLQEAGYSAQDLMRAADDAGVRMAIFNGIVNETRHQVGDAAKLADELGGALSRTEESTKKVHRAIGAAIEGPLRQLLNTIQPILERLAEWIERNKELVGIILTVATAMAALTTGGAAWLLLIPKIGEALKLLTSGPVGLTIIGLTALVTAFVAVKNATRKAREEQEQYIERKKELADKIGNEARELNALLDEYDRLTTKTNRTKEEHERLNDVVAKIGDIAPEAATKWDNLGNAIEINAGKARQAAKDMLEARKSLLEVAVARAEFEIPQQEAIIKKNEKAVLAAKKRLDDAKASLNEAVRLQAEAQRIQNRILAGESGEEVYQDALASGVVAIEGAPLPGAVDYWLNKGIQDAEKEIAKAASKLDKVSEGYYDAKEKLAQISADKAELTATIAAMNKGNLYAGLDGKSGGEGELGGDGEEGKAAAYDPKKLLEQLANELELIDKLAAIFGDTSTVATDKAKTLKSAIIELIENGIDPTNTAMGNLVEQYQGYTEVLGETEEGTYDLVAAKTKLFKALEDIDQQAAIFGDTLDTDRERLNLFQNAIVNALLNKEPIENIQDLINEYNALKEEIDAATTAEQNNKAATDMLTQAQEYLYRMTGKVVPEWEQFAQKLEDMAGKDGVLPEVAAQLKEIADQIRGAGGDVGTTNAFVDMLVNMGDKIEEAKDKFERFRNGLIDGLTDAIMKGEDFLSVLQQVANELARMFIRKGVETFINTIFPSLGAAHTGALVTSHGLVQDLPSFQSDGTVGGLKNDERIIKVLTGERVLSRDQNAAFEAGLMKPNVDIQIINNTGTPIQAEPEVSFDGAEMVVNLLLEGHRRNIGGIQKIFPSARR